MNKSNTNTEKIVRIVKLNTTPKQPGTIRKNTIMMLATRNGLSVAEVNTTINDAVDRGLLVEEDGRFRTA